METNGKARKRLKCRKGDDRWRNFVSDEESSRLLTNVEKLKKFPDLRHLWNYVIDLSIKIFIVCDFLSWEGRKVVSATKITGSDKILSKENNLTRVSFEEKKKVLIQWHRNMFFLIEHTKIYHKLWTRNLHFPRISLKALNF